MGSEYLSLSLLAIFAFISTADFHAVIRSSNGLRECRKNLSAPALEVLPGGGWDNLRNLDMGRVMNLSYSQCQTTEDGIYLIPDETFVIPQKVSSVEMNSEIISSWLEQKSSTSRSINVEASFDKLVNGKFSGESKRMKTHQVKDNSVTARVQVRNHLYTVKAYPDFTLDARFARQAEEIADAIENNQTRLAAYLSEKMVLDFGGQSHCPPQFSQHLVAISDGCQVLYCVQSGIFTGGELLPIHLPPFTRPPVISMIVTNTVAVMTEGDQAWVRIKDTKMWKVAKPEDIAKMSQMFEDDSQSQRKTVGIAFGALALIALVVAVAVLVVRKRKKFLLFRRSRGYEEIQSDGLCETTVESQTEQQSENLTDDHTQSLLA
ncbi:hypothetical protein PHYPO_G00233440 [Pangasianodon hypophthalmus]|uniref:Macrophage-expressed gene 1 protein n=1 Tax=Pangasianodon hypophthalmus TaxID=310915 RepID=A0A5N5NMK8_PANHP|nr:hypothetical protein PHYPO_G00233440 [Pangasianodon hypophthalmus]